MAFGYENVRSLHGDLNRGPKETEIQEPPRDCRGAGPRDALGEGNSFSPTCAMLWGRAAPCWDDAGEAWGAWLGSPQLWGQGVGCSERRPGMEQRWSCASLRILTNAVTGLVALK